MLVAMLDIHHIVAALLESVGDAVDTVFQVGDFTLYRYAAILSGHQHIELLAAGFHFVAVLVVRLHKKSCGKAAGGL